MTVSTLAKILSLLSPLLLSGCQLPYIMSGAVEQIKILNSRQDVKKVIESVALEDSSKDKLLFALEAKDFAVKNGLNCKQNFETFVELNRPYVSYLLIASKKHEIKPKTWWFPVVGSFPYKGYFSKAKALSAAKRLESKNYDTYTRGVSAYSSLGWFKEPILSSMLKYSKSNLAETIFHECFHTTFFIKGNTEINERIAVFFGHHFLLKFLEEKSLPNYVNLAILNWEDSKKFTYFLERTLKMSSKYYSKNSSQETLDREKLFAKIKASYLSELKPQIKSLNYDSVFLEDLNNAKLAALKTYFHKFESLESSLKNKYQNDIFKYLNAAKKLKTKKDKASFFESI